MSRTGKHTVEELDALSPSERSVLFDALVVADPGGDPELSALAERARRRTLARIDETEGQS